MPRVIESPTIVEAAGNKPKRIEEYAGRVNSNIAQPGEWVSYGTPDAGGAEYVAVCLPAFSPATVHRDG